MNPISSFLSKLNPFSNDGDIPETSAENTAFATRFQDNRFFRDTYGGESVPDTFGLVRDFNHISSVDYHKIRKMSRQLFTENMYAAGLVNRLVKPHFHTSSPTLPLHCPITGSSLY